jgi:ParB family chromosome partitioning protein
MTNFLTAEIALNKLVPSSDNVRKTGASEGIGELAESIAAHGILQNLIVRKAPRGKFAVVGGSAATWR